MIPRPLGTYLLCAHISLATKVGGDRCLWKQPEMHENTGGPYCPDSRRQVLLRTSNLATLEEPLSWNSEKSMGAIDRPDYGSHTHHGQ